MHAHDHMRRRTLLVAFRRVLCEPGACSQDASNASACNLPAADRKALVSPGTVQSSATALGLGIGG